MTGTDLVLVAEVMAISADDSPVFDPENRLLSSDHIFTICTSFITLSDREESDTHYWRLRLLDPSTELRAELSKPRRTVGLSHLSVKDFLATLPILNRKEACFSYAATQTVARSIIVKGCLAYMLFFDDATPVMKSLTSLEEYPLMSFIYQHGESLIEGVSNFTGDSALCQLVAELLMRRPTCLFELLEWDVRPPQDYDPGRVPLEWCKIQHPLTIAANLHWMHAAKGLLRASVEGNHPDLVPIVQLAESEQIKILGSIAMGSSSTAPVFSYVLENLVKMPDDCCGVKVSYPITRLEEVKKAVADSLIDGGPDDAAVRQYLYSEAAGHLLYNYCKSGSVFSGLIISNIWLVRRTLSERYGKATANADHEHSIEPRSLPSPGSISQEKASRDNVRQGPSTIHGSLLHAAAFHGRLAMIEEVLDEGADVNLRLKPHLTALHAAALSPYQSCLNLLLDRGANINATSPTHGSVLSIVSANRAPFPTIRMLLRRGASVDAVGGKYGCAVNAAIANG